MKIDYTAYVACDSQSIWQILMLENWVRVWRAGRSRSRYHRGGTERMGDPCEVGVARVLEIRNAHMLGAKTGFTH